MDTQVIPLASYIDHTLLKPTATRAEITRLCEEAVECRFASVCIPPCYVSLAADILNGTSVATGTIVGFPLGYNTTAIKVKEAETARKDGAKEIDMVINRGWIKDGLYPLMVQEVREVTQGAPDMIVKVIMELCDLTGSEKREAAAALLETGAHFLKTSTGLGKAGATLEDVRLLAEISRGRMKIKAAGGIRHASEALAFIKAGASRIGTSAGVQIMREHLSSH
ncbi:MAG: deoxyribose-phosphate aldolase [Desulfovibrionales bacterium]|nr:deoxyribose-phosphate aldolase [Desulfovibrionales bacterium]